MRLKAMLAAAALFLAAPVHAEELKLVTGNDYRPYTDEGLPGGGLATEIVEAALKEVGMGGAITWLPWKRGYSETASARFDATFPYFYTDERAQEMYYSDPILEVASKVFYKRAKHRITGYDDLNGLRMCNPLGYAMPPKLGAMVAADALKREQPNDMETCFKLLASDRVDFVATNLVQGWDIVGQTSNLSRDNVAVTPFNVVVNNLHFLASRSHPKGKALVESFNLGLRKIRDSGKLDQLIKEHMAQYMS